MKCFNKTIGIIFSFFEINVYLVYLIYFEKKLFFYFFTVFVSFL